jgi:hypothetical protein
LLWPMWTRRGLSPASAPSPLPPKTNSLAAIFFALRSGAHPRLGSLGSAALRPYVDDKDCEGEDTHQTWLQSHGVRIVSPLRGNGRKGRWPKRLRRWAVSIRQINRDRLRRATQHFRPSPRASPRHGQMRARLAARVPLHSFRTWLSERLSHSWLALADLLGWRSQAKPNL